LRRAKKIERWTEKRIQSLLWPYLLKLGHSYIIPNILFYDWECDLIGMNSQERIAEYEIKINKADLKRELRNKRYKHETLKKGQNRSTRRLPNFFYYVCPDNVFGLEDIPDHAGLIWINKKGTVIVKRKAPFIHRNKTTKSQYLRMGKAMTWRLWEKIYAPEGWSSSIQVKKVRHKGRKRRRINR